MADDQRSFGVLDWVLFGATLLLSLCIGVATALTGDRQKTTREYLTGNRKLGLLPVTFSIFMSFISAILVLGNSAEAYTYGAQAWLGGIGNSLSYIFSALVFVPLFYPLGLTSSFEYLEQRYQSHHVRTVATFLMVLSQVFYMGIGMFSPATALEAVTGFPLYGSVLAAGAVSTIYTTMGGIRAVVWTDAVQGFIYIGGVITVLAVGTERTGGLARVWELASQGGRLDNISWDLNPAVRLSVWSLVFGNLVSSLEVVGVSQASVQRYTSLTTKTKAQVSVLLIIPAILLMYTLSYMTGLVIYAYYEAKGCDPLRGPGVSNSNQLLPYFILEVVDIPGIPGLFLAVLFSGALSSLSSTQNALAAVTWKHFLEPHLNHLQESRQALVTKGLSLFYGCAGIGMAFLIQGLPSNVMQISSTLTGSVGGPLLGLFILGAFFPWANWIGACVGAAVGLGLSGWAAVGALLEKPYVRILNTTVDNCTFTGNETATPYSENPEGVFGLYRLSFNWFSATGMAAMVVVGLVVSFITGPMDPAQHDPRLVAPLFDRLMCCLPLSVRQLCWCGVRHDDQTETTQMDHKEKTAVAFNGTFQEKSADTADTHQVTVFSKEKTNGIKEIRSLAERTGRIQEATSQPGMRPQEPCFNNYGFDDTSECVTSQKQPQLVPEHHSELHISTLPSIEQTSL